MTSETPPSEYFTNIGFNSSFYQNIETTGLSEGEANNLYFKKNIDDYSPGQVLQHFKRGVIQQA
jgi:hypothetical protein